MTSLMNNVAICSTTSKRITMMNFSRKLNLEVVKHNAELTFKIFKLKHLGGAEVDLKAEADLGGGGGGRTTLLSGIRPPAYPKGPPLYYFEISIFG